MACYNAGGRIRVHHFIVFSWNKLTQNQPKWILKKKQKRKIVIVVVLTNEIMNTNLKVGAGSPGIYDIPRSHKQISYDLQQKILGKKSKKALKVDQNWSGKKGRGAGANEHYW